MKVILLKDVGGVGQKGEVKTIADGHAMNYLIPRGLAKQATTDALRAHSAEAHKEKLAKDQAADALMKNIHAVEGARVRISSKATKKGGLFKAVGAQEVRDAIKKHTEVLLPLESIVLDKPIKAVGEYGVPIEAGSTSAVVTIVVEAA